MIAIIPTHKVSTGLPGKNLASLANKPMLYYTISAALRAKSLETIFVASDDPAVLVYAKGFSVPTLTLPSETTRGNSETVDSLAYCVPEIRRTTGYGGPIVTLRPTSPLRTSVHIEAAIKLFYLKQYESLVSVFSDTTCNPLRAKAMTSHGLLVNFAKFEGHPEEKLAPILRQALPPAYFRNGALYITPQWALEKRCLWTQNCGAYIMSKKDSVNVNDADDLAIAEALLCHATIP